VVDPALQDAAEDHATAMAARGFFSHRGADGSTLTTRLRRHGYRYSAAAENIAAGQSTAAEVVQSWMKSSGHRRNITDCALRHTGIALVFDPDDTPIRGNRQPLRYYWVQVFASP
ncbi:MAG: CAP domain-containing protein, partial [Tabrizicola sp.]|nr:CAP domain-containing protein [Tabrizicola sp.]